MSAEIIKFYPANAAKDPDAVLEKAVGEYETVLIIGWDHDGNLDARANLDLGAAEALLLLELFKTRLVNGLYAEDDE